MNAPVVSGAVDTSQQRDPARGLGAADAASVPPGLARAASAPADASTRRASGGDDDDKGEDEEEVDEDAAMAAAIIRRREARAKRGAAGAARGPPGLGRLGGTGLPAPPGLAAGGLPPAERQPRARPRVAEATLTAARRAAMLMGGTGRNRRRAAVAHGGSPPAQPLSPRPWRRAAQSMATAAQAAGATADSAANGTQARASAGDAALQAAVARTARIAAQGANGRGGDEGRGAPSFVCPITHELMVDPVSTVDGQVYERRRSRVAAQQ